MRLIGMALLAMALGAVVFGCKKRETTPSADAPPVTVAPPAPVPPVPKTPAPEAARKRGTFTASKGTTYVTSPLTATGHVDYVAALNERLKKGVTPETNANVAIWQVIGPTPWDNTKVPPGYFEAMGVSAPPADGSYFVGLQVYANRVLGPVGAQNVSEMMKSHSDRPWTRNQDVTIAGWLEANEKPLAALRDAAKRPKYYNPLIPEQTEHGRSKGMYSALLPSVQLCREFAGALAARAMLHLGEGRTVDAWQDLLACHRLGRLVGNGGTLIERLVGAAVEMIACRAEAAFLDAAKPDAKTIEQCLRDLLSLPTPGDLAEKIDLERFAFLDVFMQLDARGTEYLLMLSPDAKMDANELFSEIMLALTDWDPALQIGNKWFDRMADTVRSKDRLTRVQKYAEFSTDIKSLKQEVAQPTRRYDELMKNGVPQDKAIGQAFGEVFTSLLMPAAHKLIDAVDRERQTFDVTVTAFALAWYQRVNGRYPDSLAKLAPTFLTAVPGDLFSEKGLIYKLDASGFLLYSVGVNGADDGGRGYDQPPADDIAVRVPLPSKP